MPKVFHVVMPEMTVTFLEWERVQDFVGPKTLDELINRVVVCESEVTELTYTMLCDWQKQERESAKEER